MDESILAGASTEFRDWFVSKKATEDVHFETLRKLMEAQAVAASDAIRPPPAVPGGGEQDMDLDDADEDIDKLGQAQASVAAAKSAATSATGDDKAKAEQLSRPSVYWQNRSQPWQGGERVGSSSEDGRMSGSAAASGNCPGEGRSGQFCQ
eukprot:2067222-Pyramimonas_sp.AAC.1